MAFGESAGVCSFIELRFAPGTQVVEVDTAVTDLAEVIESFTLAGERNAP